MKVNLGYIKIVVLASLIIFLFSFTNKRNSNRNLTKTDVVFVDNNEPFITLAAVNKLLIQNNDSVAGILKDMVALKEAEDRLLANPMIREADVFVTVDGVLGAKIEQRNPVARVDALEDYYLDADGKKMPLSSVYAARVPLITGFSKTEFTEITPLLLKINEDSFMQKSVVGIHVLKDGNIVLQMRKQDFQVMFGKLDQTEKKFQNYKAFFQKAKKDNKLQSYKTVALQFGNQVVATKKD